MWFEFFNWFESSADVELRYLYEIERHSMCVTQKKSLPWHRILTVTRHAFLPRKERLASARSWGLMKITGYSTSWLLGKLTFPIFPPSASQERLRRSDLELEFGVLSSLRFCGKKAWIVEKKLPAIFMTFPPFPPKLRSFRKRFRVAVLHELLVMTWRRLELNWEDFYLIFLL